MIAITDTTPDVAEDTRLIDAAALVRIATGGADVLWSTQSLYCPGHGRRYAAIVWGDPLISIWRLDERGWASYHLGDITARTTVRDAYLMRARYAQRRAKELGL